MRWRGNLAFYFSDALFNNYFIVCRGHLGGLIGGASVAWLLGPRLIKQQQPFQSRGDSSPMLPGRFVDQPPVAWLAYPQGTLFGVGSSGRRPVGGSQSKKSDNRASKESSVEDGGKLSVDRASIPSGPPNRQRRRPMHSLSNESKNENQPSPIDERHPPAAL